MFNPLEWPALIGQYATRTIMFLIGSILFVLGFIALNEGPAVEIVSKGVTE